MGEKCPLWAGYERPAFSCLCGSTDNDPVTQAAGCRFKAHTPAADPALLVIATEARNA